MCDRPGRGLPKREACLSGIQKSSGCKYFFDSVSDNLVNGDFSGFSFAPWAARFKVFPSFEAYVIRRVPKEWA
jgi:hypothetical protein